MAGFSTEGVLYPLLPITRKHDWVSLPLRLPRGGTDHIDHQLRAGEHGDVAAGDLRRGGAHALRQKALQLGLDGAVIRGHDVRTGLRPPGNTVKLLREQVRSRRKVSCPDDFLLLLRQVTCKALDTIR